MTTLTTEPWLLGSDDNSPAGSVASLADEYARRFPWYRDLLDRRGVAPAASPVSLTDLPLIDHEVLSRHYYEADSGHLPDASVFRTSGTSTGQRKRILFAPSDDDAYVAQRKALFQDFLGGVRPGEVAVADLGTGHAAASARRIFEELGFEARDIDFESPIREHVAKLNAWRPDVLFTMPMIMDRLLQSPEPLHISPRKIMVVGDVAPENWRRRVAERFGIGTGDVLDVFGSIEIGAIAYSCAETGLYHFHDHIVPEVVAPADLYRDGDAPAMPPGSGILLLTSLSRRYFPALRYVTGDVVVGLRTITWRGRSVHAFDRIDGRFGGDFKHGERVSNHDLCQAVSEVLPGAAFEVSAQGGLEIRVVASDLSAFQAGEIRRLIRAASPDVAQMIDSGLVEDIKVTAIRTDQLKSNHAKRQFNLKER